jgi:hypothetical protein
MWHARERGEKCTRFCWESPKERDQSERQGVDGRMRSNCILVKIVGRVWSEFTWLRIRTGGVFCEHGVNLRVLEPRSVNKLCRMNQRGLWQNADFAFRIL